MAEAAMPNRAQRAANKVLRETKNAAKAQETRGRNTPETMENLEKFKDIFERAAPKWPKFRVW